MKSQRSSLSKKYHTNIQSHSKNSLINSLINQKLYEEKQFVKSRVDKLIKRAPQQTQNDQQSSSFNIRKRASSLKNLNVSMSKIKQSIGFNSLSFKPTSEQAQFMVSRQYKSPLLSEISIKQTALARQKGNSLQIKFSNTDKNSYPDLFIDNLSLNEFQRVDKQNKTIEQFSSRIQDSLDKQLWLTGSPHVQMLMEKLAQNDIKLNINPPSFNTLPIVKSSVFNDFGNQFKPIATSQDSTKLINGKNNISSNLKLLQNITTGQQQLIYDFRKYHKDDYVSLEKWFQKNILMAHKMRSGIKVKPEIKKQIQKNTIRLQNTQMQTILNNLYSIHICGFQELMRLTYIQSCQKALLFEKMFWSLIRLFSTLIQQQHKINYTQYKIFQQQLKQQRIMYEQRCQKLEIMMIRAQKQSQTTIQIRKRLSMAYITYSRVNHHMSQQLQITNNILKQQTNSYQFLNMKLMKLIEYLQMEDKIKVISDDYEDSYFYVVGNSAKLQKLVTIQKSQSQIRKIKVRKFQRELEEGRERQNKKLYNNTKAMSNSKNQQQQITNEDITNKILKNRAKLNSTSQNNNNENLVFQTRVGSRIAAVQHQLNKYWSYKQDSLKIHNLIDQQLMHFNTHDIGTSTYEKFESSDFTCQFPQKQEKSFSEFLAEELQKQRTNNKIKIQQQNDLYVSLKELYQESYQKIRNLQKKKNQLISQNQKKDRIISSKQTKIKELQDVILLSKKQINTKQLTIESLLRQIRQLQNKFPVYEQKVQTLTKKLDQQIQNSQSLVRNNLQTKQKMDKMSIKFKQMQQRLKQLSTKKEQIQIQLKSSKQKQEEQKNKFQVLDKNLKAVSPAVDLFLQYKRFDKDSTVIANVKRDLQKYFADYFCKDSDVFLTKG